MHITYLKATNLKGRSFGYSLTPATLIVGPNYTGKTAVSDAIRLTLLGYLPELGKRNPSSFELASDASMEASLTLSSGIVLTREFHLEGSAVKSSNNMEPLNFDTPLLNSGEYFEKTENERIDYVFSKVKLPEEFTPDGVIAKLQRISFGDGHTEQIEKAKADFILVCQETFEEADTVAAALALLSDKKGPLASEFTKLNARVKDTTGAIRVLTELKLRESECSAETLTDIGNEIRRLQGLIEEASKESGRLQAQAQQARAVDQRRNEIARLLQLPAPQFQPFAQEAWEDPRPKLEQQLTELDAKLAAMPELAKGTNAALYKAEQAMEMLREQRQPIEQRIDLINGEIAEVKTKPCCPFCQGKAKGWQKHLIAKFNEEIAELSKKALEIDVPVMEAKRANAQKAHADFEAAEERLNSATALRASIAGRISAAERIATQRQQAQWSHDSGIHSAQAAHDERQQSLREEQSRLVAIDAPTQSEVDAAYDTVTKLRSSLVDQNTKRDAAKKLQQHLLGASQAAEEHETAAAALAVCKKFGEEVKAMKGAMVEAAFGALLATANAICGDILPSPLAYHQGELGRWAKSGRFIKHSVFSGTEKALAYISLAAGLSASASFKLAIIDELARITPDLQLRVMQKLSEAVEHGVLDQIIAILPLGPDDCEMFTPPENWSLIRTVAGEEVAA